MIMKYSNNSSTDLLLFCLFFSVVLAAIAPLSYTLNGIIIYTPYIPLGILLLLLSISCLSKQKRIFKRREEYVFIISQILIVLLTITRSEHTTVSLSASVVALYTVGLFGCTRILFRNRILNRYNLVFAVKIIFVVLTIVAILQIVQKKDIGVVANYFGQNLESGSYYETNTFRVSGTFTNPNKFSQVYTIYASIILSVLLFTKRSLKFGSIMVFSAIVLFVVGSSLSRSGLFFSLLAQIALYGFWVSRGVHLKGRKCAILAVLVFGFLMIALIGFSFVGYETIPGVSRFSEIGHENSAINNRIVVYKGVLQLLRDPFVLLFGVGSGQLFQSMAEHGIFVQYKSWIAPEDMYAAAHNWILQILSEHGVIVLALYVFFIYKTILRGWFLRKMPGGWLPASLAIILVTLYLSAFQFGTAGVTVALLTPIVIIFAWIQNEYDLFYSKHSRQIVTDLSKIRS